MKKRIETENSSSLYDNFTLHYYIVHELNNWPRNTSHNFT